jgi:hypothetical protein
MGGEGDLDAADSAADIEAVSVRREQAPVPQTGDDLARRRFQQFGAPQRISATLPSG